MSQTPLPLLEKGVFQASEDKPSPSKEGVGPGEDAPEAQGEPVSARGTWMPASWNLRQVALTDYHWNQDTPELIRISTAEVVEFSRISLIIL